MTTKQRTIEEAVERVRRRVNEYPDSGNEVKLGVGVADLRALLALAQSLPTPVEGVERVASALEPELFCGDERREHQAASPIRVDVAKENARVKAWAAIAALSDKGVV